MLTQERFEEITRIVTRDGAATVPELARLLETSESTIRRDLVQLDSLGKVRKVHGGATAVREAEPVQERNMQENTVVILKTSARSLRMRQRWCVPTILFFLMQARQPSSWQPT